MTEEGQGIIVLKDNKNKNTNKEENKNELNRKVDVDINNYNQNVLDSKENLEVNPPKNEQLEFNKKNIYELSLETIGKLGISPCKICQSNNYSIFIPDTAYYISNQDEKSQDQTIENENPKKNNLEVDYIKQVKNQNIFFPILICKQNHQTCLICNNPPHNNTLCNKNNIDQYNAISKLNIIKDNFPEKANIIESMKGFASNLNKKNDAGEQAENPVNCCCCLKSFFKVLLASILLLIWIFITIFLFYLAAFIFVLSILCRFICVICNGLGASCCNPDTKIEDYDRGDYIERVITIDEQRRRENKATINKHDDAIACCGNSIAKSVISVIPWGFKKIWSILDL